MATSLSHEATSAPSGRSWRASHEPSACHGTLTVVRAYRHRVGPPRPSTASALWATVDEKAAFSHGRPANEDTVRASSSDKISWHAPAATSQCRSVRSADQESSRPSGRDVAQSTALVCPSNFTSGPSVAGSQREIVPSSDHEMIWWSESTAAPTADWMSPLMVPKGSPVASGTSAPFAKPRPRTAGVSLQAGRIGRPSPPGCRMCYTFAVRSLGRSE
jgi:hypothetical protein